MSCKLYRPVLLWALTASAALSQPGHSQSALTVLVVNGFGELETGYITVRSADAIILEHRPVDGHPFTVSVPYGKYTVTFEHAILKPRSRQLVVDQPEVLLVLTTRVSDAVGEFATTGPAGISIRIKPTVACSEGPLWVKVVGVFSDFDGTRSINSYGYALFEPVEPGQYMVMILDGRQVRATQFVKVIGKTGTADIQMQNCPPK